MLVEESIWIKDILNKEFTSNDFPLLNIGSSTENFRKETQPHIHNNVFKPLEEKNLKVFHTDLKNDTGIDLEGDLNDVLFQEKLKKLNVRSIICSNLLEHLQNPSLICNSILQILPENGKLIVTVPKSFPYHKDPIDTLLRPNVKELFAMFPNTKLLKGEVLETNRSYLDDLKANKKYMIIMILRWLMPFYKYSEWKHMIKDFFNRHKKYSATCILLKTK